MIRALLAVILWDAWFWDDTLPPGEGVGTRLGDEDVTAWSADGYVLNRVWDVPEPSVRPKLDGPVDRMFGAVTVRVEDDGEKLVATVQEQAIDVDKLGLTSPDRGAAPTVEGSPAGAPADQVTLDSLAPFPVTIDIPGKRILSAPVALPDRAWPIVAGMDVRVGREDAVVLAEDAGTVTVRAATGRTDAELRLANPADRRLPVILPAAVVALAGATLLTVARRTMRRPLAAVVLLATCLACGGLWNDAKSNSFDEMTVRLGKVADGPEKDEVGRMLDEGWLQTRQGKLGIAEISSFRTDFDRVVSDDVITDEELTVLRRSSVSFPVPATSDADRDAALAVKRDKDAKLVTAKTATVDRHFGSWDLDDLREHATAAGWVADSCDRDESDGVVMTTCQLSKTGFSGTLFLSTFHDVDNAKDFDGSFTNGSASRRDGTSVLHVTVADGAAAMAVLDTILPPGTSPEGKDLDWVKTAFTAIGWSVKDCNDSGSEGYRLAMCHVARSDQAGDAIITWRERSHGPLARDIDDGAAKVSEGQTSLSLILRDTKASEALRDALTGG
jgi:hypothetical protein